MYNLAWWFGLLVSFLLCFLFHSCLEIKICLAKFLLKIHALRLHKLDVSYCTHLSALLLLNRLHQGLNVFLLIHIVYYLYLPLEVQDILRREAVEAVSMIDLMEAKGCVRGGLRTLGVWGWPNVATR